MVLLRPFNDHDVTDAVHRCVLYVRNMPVLTRTVPCSVCATVLRALYSALLVLQLCVLSVLLDIDTGWISLCTYGMHRLHGELQCT